MVQPGQTVYVSQISILLSLCGNVLFLVMKLKISSSEMRLCYFMICYFVMLFHDSGNHMNLRICLQFYEFFLRNSSGWRPVVEFYALILKSGYSKDLTSSKPKGRCEHLGQSYACYIFQA